MSRGFKSVFLRRFNCSNTTHEKLWLVYVQKFYVNQQVQKSVDNQFKKAIEKYRDDPDLQNAIDAVQEGVSEGILISVVVLQMLRIVQGERPSYSPWSEQ